MKFVRSDLEIRVTSQGNKVYSTAYIPSRVSLCEISGNIIDTVTYLQHPQKQDFLQIAKNKYIGLAGTLDDFIAHSCDPNAYIYSVGSRCFVYSIYDIRPQVEITIDYSLSSTDEFTTWSMACQCSSIKCRKLISGFQFLSSERKQDYYRLGIVPKFLL